jgi:hypothetical protein
MKNIGILLITLACSLAFVGCKSAPSPKKVEEISLIPEAEIEFSSGKNIVCDNELFRLEVSSSLSGGVTVRLQTLQDSANISDLGAFGTCAYRRIIKGKLSKGVPLSAAESALLEFCIETQISAVSAYADIMYADMQGCDTVFAPPKAQNVDLEKNILTPTISPSPILTMAEVRKLQNNFCNGKSPLRDAIRSWGDYCNKTDHGYAIRACSEIGNMYSIIDRDLQRRLDEQLGCSYLPSATIINSAKIVQTGASMKDCLIGSAEWHNLVKHVDRCIFEFRVMDCDMQMASKITTDSSWKSLLDDYSMKSSMVIGYISRKYRYAFYDLPFLFFCNKAYDELNAQKHWYNDDEDGMERVLIDFYQKIDGSRMILNIASQESATMQSKVIAFAKDEMGTQFDRFQVSTRLYRVNLNNDDPFGNNKIE